MIDLLLTVFLFIPTLAFIICSIFWGTDDSNEVWRLRAVNEDLCAQVSEMTYEINELSVEIDELKKTYERLEEKNDNARLSMHRVTELLLYVINKNYTLSEKGKDAFRKALTDACEGKIDNDGLNRLKSFLRKRK